MASLDCAHTFTADFHMATSSCVLCGLTHAGQQVGCGKCGAGAHMRCVQLTHPAPDTAGACKVNTNHKRCPSGSLVRLRPPVSACGDAKHEDHDAAACCASQDLNATPRRPSASSSSHGSARTLRRVSTLEIMPTAGGRVPTGLRRSQTMGACTSSRVAQLRESADGVRRGEWPEGATDAIFPSHNLVQRRVAAAKACPPGGLLPAGGTPLKHGSPLRSQSTAMSAGSPEDVSVVVMSSGLVDRESVPMNPRAACQHDFLLHRRFALRRVGCDMCSHTLGRMEGCFKCRLCGAKVHTSCMAQSARKDAAQARVQRMMMCSC